MPRLRVGPAVDAAFRLTVRCVSRPQQLLPHLYSSATQLAPTGMASDPGEGQQGPGGFQSPAFQDLVNAISGLNFMHNRPHSDGN